MQVLGTSSEPLTAETLADLDEEQRSVRFAELQNRLVRVWGKLRSGHEGESIVVVPSRPIDNPNDPAAKSQALEERMLFLLLLLRQPRLRVIYVSSLPISPAIIDYYLGMLAGVVPAHALSRLSLVAAHDGSARPLSAKLLERPRVIERVRSLIPDTDLCHLVPYTTGPLERDLALLLGVPMYGADPRFLKFGTKTGCRQLFIDEDVSHPFGSEGIDDLPGIVSALAELRVARPEAEEALVKLNEGVAGRGNALVDLRDLPTSGSSEERAALEHRVRDMQLEARGLEFDAYIEKLSRTGGVVEERISGAEFRSPSVQLRVTPPGEVQLLSTHDQLLGGPTGQSYLGCVFPADPVYAVAITDEARKVGERLAREGVLGRFALDFVVVRDNGGDWRPYAIEINLRKGGTTHPYLTLEFLTDGRYHPETATFLNPNGEPKFVVATDHLESEELKGLLHADLFDVIVRRGLHFDQARQRGVVFHMMSALTELGRIGLTAVGDSPGEAKQIYDEAERALLDEGRAALAPSMLPPLAV